MLEQITNGRTKYATFGEIDFLSIYNGTFKSFKNKLYVDTGSVSDDVVDINLEMMDIDEAPSRARMRPVGNTIWFAKIKDSPKYLLVKDYMHEIIDNYVLSTGFMAIKVIPHYLNIYYYYFTSTYFLRLQASVCNGVTMEALNNGILNDLLIPYFSETQATVFNEACNDLINYRYSLTMENKKLSILKRAYLEKFFR